MRFAFAVLVPACVGVQPALDPSSYPQPMDDPRFALDVRRELAADELWYALEAWHGRRVNRRRVGVRILIAVDRVWRLSANPVRDPELQALLLAARVEQTLGLFDDAVAKYDVVFQRAIATPLRIEAWIGVMFAVSSNGDRRAVRNWIARARGDPAMMAEPRVVSEIESATRILEIVDGIPPALQ